MLNTVFTEVTFSYTGSTTSVLQVKNTSTQPDWSKGTLSVFPNQLLGYTAQSTVSGYNIDFTHNFATAQQAIDLTPGITPFSYKVSSDVAQTQVDVFERNINNLLIDVGLTFKAKLRYNDTSRQNINAFTVSQDDTYSISPNYVYGFRMQGNTFYRAGAQLSNSAMNLNTAIDPNTFYTNNSGFGYASEDNAWAVSQFGYSQSMPTSVINSYQFPLNETLQIADIQAVLNTITGGMTATILPDKDVVAFSNPSLNTFRVYPNHKLGIYRNDGDQSIYVVPAMSNFAMNQPIDLTARNMCMSVGLSIYHDGRTAIGLGSALDQGKTRPIRRDIVATVYNGTAVNYGQMIQYNNPSDTWLPSYYKNISQIGVRIYNDMLQTIPLHQKNIHLEIDIMADAI
jgi:hypothetical protein